MSQTKKFIMTYEGVKKLEEELEYLKTVKRKEITEKIKVALVKTQNMMKQRTTKHLQKEEFFN